MRAGQQSVSGTPVRTFPVIPLMKHNLKRQPIRFAGSISHWDNEAVFGAGGANFEEAQVMLFDGPGY